MGEILSHAEVEAILAAIEPSRPGNRPVPTSSVESAETWEPHDFRQTEPMQGVALKVVQALHAGICQRWQVRLESLLQSAVNVRAIGACRSTAAEFLQAVATKSLICHLAPAKSAADSLLVWSLDLVQSLVTGMLGGTVAAATEPTTHAMTSIELRLLGRLNEAVIRELSVLLDEPLNVVAVGPSLDGDSDLSAKAPRIWFSFEVNIGSVSGLIHLGLPGPTPGAVLSGRFSGSSDLIQDRAGLTAIPPGIQQVSVQVAANLAHVKLRAADLAALQVGDVLMTELSPTETISLQLDGRTLCQATVGTLLGRKALRLVESRDRATGGSQ